MLNIAVIGASGRMGGAIIRAIQNDAAISLSCALECPESGVLGQDAGMLAGTGPLGISVVDNPKEQEFDIMIDFSTPASTLLNIEFCNNAGRAIVIGTTGMNDEVLEKMRQASEQIPV
ncbi:MAG: 4-hydroxy-tetrahydrodipicolinate reductase, partial [Gammaproteobacteria bacterium]|nr:4-hydroxy-tetrahydrodipicolinate reductase [Gammaproteobacteria bacterium]